MIRSFGIIYTMERSKIFFIVCNYNAQRNGSLADSMKSLERLKTNETKILVWDNASSDGSQDILKDYQSKGIIDNLVLSDRNMGKAYALNVLATFARNIYDAMPMDILVSMDSDICIHNGKFANELIEVFSSNRKLGFIGFEYYEDEAFSKKSSYHKMAEGIHIRHDIAVPLCGVEYHPLDNFGGFLGGALMAMRVGMFSEIGGYSTDLANGGNIALYGGDDSMLENKLWRSYGKVCMFLFDERPQILHRPDSDDGYREWKGNCLKSMQKDGYGKCYIPKVGYYD